MKFVEGQITDKLVTNVVIAKEQEEYNPLPCFKNQYGIVAMALELTDEEIEKIKKDKKIYVSLLTFNHPQQPIYIAVEPEKLNNNVEYYTDMITKLLRGEGNGKAIT